MVVTVMIHALGTALWARYLLDRLAEVTDRWRLHTNFHVLATTALVLLGLHILEVVLWAAVYLQALHPQYPWTFEKTVYFSLVTFTTLGYGDITLAPGLRLLSGIEALNGILLVGWSTALLFAVMQRIWQAGLGKHNN